MAYFGEKKSTRCGICDVCLSKNKTELTELIFEQIKEAIYLELSKTPQHIFHLVSHIKGFDEDKILAVLRWLLDNNKVIRRKDETLTWYHQLDLNI